MKKKRVLILGVTGMLGHALYRVFSAHEHLETYATSREAHLLEQWFPPKLIENIKVNVDAQQFSTIAGVIADLKPDVVVNCIGLIKQLPEAAEPISAITINSLLPHRIARICQDGGMRMIHISTDCVFDGQKGNYTELDVPNAGDLYGRSKLLGEVDGPHCVTLRTSIIGHELKGRHGLIEWFLAQKGAVKGYTQAIYSGIPTGELARIIDQYVLPNPDLCGVYHVSSEPISKYHLLQLVAQRYNKKIVIERDGCLQIDRSLSSSAFQRITGYAPPSWPQLVDSMFKDYMRIE